MRKNPPRAHISRKSCICQVEKKLVKIISYLLSLAILNGRTSLRNHAFREKLSKNPLRIAPTNSWDRSTSRVDDFLWKESIT
jgi:hypothetical protein